MIQPEHPWMRLAPAQRGLYFAQQREPDRPTWTTAEVVEILGPLDVDALGEAVEVTHSEQPGLRVRFRSTPTGPQQQVVDRAHPWSVLDLVEAPDPVRMAEAWLRLELGRPMDLAAGDVVRSGVIVLAHDRHWFWHAAHHVVVDGFGIVQVLRRVAELYTARADVTPPPAPAADLPGWIEQAAEVERAEEAEGAATFWTDRLIRFDDVVSVAGRAVDPVPGPRRAVVELSLDAQQALTSGARRLGSGWSDLFHVAVGSWQARMRDQLGTRIGIPLMNRARAGTGTLLSSTTVCTAMNVLPATVLAGASTVAEALAAFAQEQEALRMHPFTRQEDLTRQLARMPGGEGGTSSLSEGQSSGVQLFGCQVNVIPLALDLGFGEQTRGTVRNLTAGPVEDLTVTLRGLPGRRGPVRLEVDAHPDLYSQTEVEAHLARLVHWLDVWARATPEARIADLPLLSATEFEQVVHAFNTTDRPRRSATLAERFAEQVGRTPDALAIVDGERSLSYAEVSAAVDRLARALVVAGIEAGEVVGVMVPRSVELWIALHAVQRLGAVHLPLDAEQPTKRLSGMLRDASVHVVVVAHDEETGLLPPDVCGVHVHSSAPELVLPPLPGEVAAPAYVLFTSGSTGRPKGVVVHHEAIDNRLAWMQHEFPIAVGHRVLAKTPITFDVSVWEHFWPWQVGATVVVAGPGVHRDPRRLAGLVVHERVDVLHFVPSMLRAFLSDRVATGQVRDAQASGRHAVAAVVCSGEALVADLVRECREVFGVAPTNLYGPTEAAVDVTCQRTDDLAGALVPIGRPIWNTSAHVLDRWGNPMPVGVPGRLWLGGVQVALGYLGQPELTAEKFVADRFGRWSGGRWAAGERLYDTGDLACWLPDGALACLGRGDDQVKVRGQRVELGEVEAALSGLPGVNGVVAGLVEGTLTLWFVPVDPVDVVGAIATLERAAAERLPDGERPTRWVPVAGIPLSTAGKADRAALARSTPAAERAVVEAPEDLDTQRIAQIFAELLTLTAVAPDEDFFALGGDSLKVLAMMGRIEDAFGVTLELRQVFGAPTPRLLAGVLSGEAAEAGDDFAQILVLRPGQPDVAPLVLLPPAGGLGWCYSSLLPHLPREIGVISVQAPGIEQGSPEPVADLAALAARQLAAVQQVVGSRPFHVAGWSLGGMAAHQVAAVARKAGVDVRSCVALDAYPSSAWAHLGEPDEAEALLGILRLGGAEHLLADLPDGTALDRAATLDLLRRSGSALASLPEAALAGAIESVVQAAALVRSSAHDHLVGDLDVVVASAPRVEHWLDPQAWSDHTAGQVRVHQVACRHGEMVRAPWAAEVASVLLEVMNRSTPVGAIGAERMAG